MDDGAGATTVRVLDAAFSAVPAAVGEVRSEVKLLLAELGLSGISDDVVLIASELFTNATQYGSGREIRVRLTREPHAVVLAVWDSSDARPVRKRAASDAAPDAEALTAGHAAGTGGRGLPIVAAISEECGVTPTEPNGKWVWARYAINDVVPSARVLASRQ
jgi:anti-sigma regulatory factor (Ser/Thr protein kinase)